MTDITIDPWLKLREKTEVRNDIATVADHYAKIQKLALAQLELFKGRKTVRQDTIDGLEFMVKFCEQKAMPLFENLQKLDVELYEMTERLNNE
jgi:hypothetical protein